MAKGTCIENNLFNLSIRFHFHKWKEVFNTGMRSYQECGRCERRR